MNVFRSSLPSRSSIRKPHNFHAPRRRLQTAMRLPSRTTSHAHLLSSIPKPSPIARLTQTTPFSTTAPLLKKKKRGQQVTDRRITLIRYFLWHYKRPRPLRLSRSRALRHWTIHRAWNLFRSKQRAAHQLELEKQYNAMRAACEALRLIGDDGLAVDEGGRAVKPPGARDPVAVQVKVGEEMQSVDVEQAAKRQADVGRLFRAAMNKGGVFDGVPIEYARSQTDTPRRDGWEHGWKR